jgi:uncharacterized membrane protein
MNADADQDQPAGPGRETALGVPPGVAAMLGYLGFWVSGVLLLLIERRNPFVRFHAAQSTIVFAVLSALGLAGGAVTTAAAFVSPAWFHIASVATELVWLAILLLWAVCLARALRGGLFRLPIAARLADRLAGTGG